jgi:hypothetical protein
MKKENQEFINSSLKIAFLILEKVKDGMSDNQRNHEFYKLVQETKEVVIYEAENFLIEPTFEIKPLKRFFKPEDEPLRKQIRKEVSKRFDEFMKG